MHVDSLVRSADAACRVRLRSCAGHAGVGVLKNTMAASVNTHNLTQPIRFSCLPGPSDSGVKLQCLIFLSLSLMYTLSNTHMHNLATIPG